MRKPSCKSCGKEGHYAYQCFLTAKKVPKTAKRIKRIGRRGLEYIEWRDNVAIPHLTAHFGYKCAVCGSDKNLDVAHIKGRGANPQMKMSLDNVVWKCRTCHRKEHNG